MPAALRAGFLQAFVRGSQLSDLIAQPPRVVLDVSQQQPGVGQLRFGLLARAFQLLDSPADHFALRFPVGLSLRGLGSRLLRCLKPCLPRNAQEQGHQAPMVQISTARNGNSDTLGPLRCRRRF